MSQGKETILFLIMLILTASVGFETVGSLQSAFYPYLLAIFITLAFATLSMLIFFVFKSTRSDDKSIEVNYKGDNLQPVKSLHASNEIKSLLYAVIKGNTFYIKDCLDKGSVDVNAVCDRENNTLLILASQYGKADIVDLLLNREADASAKNTHGDTALIAALKHEHTNNIAVVEKLLKIQDITDNINAQGEFGCTALIWASMGGYYDIVGLLLDVDSIDVDIRDNHGFTALDWARQNDHKDCIKLLESKSAKESPSSMLINNEEHDSDSSHLGSDDASANIDALMNACMTGNLSTVEACLRQGGIDVNAQDENGYTPLMCASRDGHYDVVKLLLDNSADLNAQDENGFTPLILATFHGHKAVVRLLLEKSNGINVNAQDKSGHTALDHASRSGHNVIVELLKSKGAKAGIGSSNQSVPGR